MQSNGFSVGIGDAWVLPSIQDTIDCQIETQLDKAHSVASEYQNGALVQEGNYSIEQTKENRIVSVLAKARDSAGKTTVQMSSIDNNVRQMCVCGQQIVEGKRIPYGFKDRTLPHFAKFDDSPMARGFVRNSFVRGVTPSGFFFHACVASCSTNHLTHTNKG
ncbi:UNVERIFIED_CONTAM: DNA-directed RNA polymerase II subunit rpb1 [Siphonaria sp. JEL0065]|nr:DNA-directed RNA polymerase II subunit rpb1 [Siphonaria sp. JEL0065]